MELCLHSESSVIRLSPYRELRLPKGAETEFWENRYRIALYFYSRLDRSRFPKEAARLRTIMHEAKQHALPYGEESREADS